MIGDGVDGRRRQVFQSAFGRELVDRIDGYVLHSFVRGGLDLSVGHEAHGPGAVVVSVQVGVGIVLLAEQSFRQRAVGLVGFYDQRSRWIIAVTQFDGGFGAAHFNALHAQDVNYKRDASGVFLIRRNDEAVGRLFGAGGERVAGLDVEILQDDLRKRGDELEGGENAGFCKVGVVAHRPEHGFVGRIGAIPLTLGHIAETTTATEESRIWLRDGALHGGSAAFPKIS